MIPDYNLKSFKDLCAHSQKIEREDTAWLLSGGRSQTLLRGLSGEELCGWGSLGHCPAVTLQGQLQGLIQMDKTGQKQINTAQHFISEGTKAR